jgi:hypothetical protein
MLALSALVPAVIVPPLPEFAFLRCDTSHDPPPTDLVVLLRHFLI